MNLKIIMIEVNCVKKNCHYSEAKIKFLGGIEQRLFAERISRSSETSRIRGPILLESSVLTILATLMFFELELKSIYPTK